MNVLVDTPIWSFALRRKRHTLGSEQISLITELAALVRSGDARLLGMVRQEILSGISEPSRFERIRAHLRAFQDVSLAEEDHEAAAQIQSQCRARGIAASAVDALLCATSLRRDWPIFTTDKDFSRYARVIPIRLHAVPSNGA